MVKTDYNVALRGFYDIRACCAECIDSKATATQQAVEMISPILQLLRATSNAQLFPTVSWSDSVSSITLANHIIIPDCSSIASALIEAASPSKQFFVSRLADSTYSDDILDYTRDKTCSYLTHLPCVRLTKDGIRRHEADSCNATYGHDLYIVT